MTRLPTAAALAILLLTAGVAGVVSAEPNGTANQTTTTTGVDVRVTDVPPASSEDDATFEQQLARRLAQYDLTDAQVREIVTEASRLREAGASRLVIRSSIVMHLYEFGVDAPFLYADGADDEPPADTHRRFHRFVASLDVTPEQARQLHAMAHRMLADGAPREDVYEAIRRQVAAWDDGADYDSIDRLVQSISDRHDLDHRQTVQLERLIRGMAEDGADRTEIRRAVSRLLHSWGITEIARVGVR